MRQRTSFRIFASATLVALALSASDSSRASVAIALTVDDVARASEVVARVTALDATSAWEDGRIVTTTRVRLDRVLAGGAGVSREVRVRTLGGVVDGVGQVVEGEPAFSPSTSSIVFLAPARAGASTFAVVGRAQGQLVVARAASGREIAKVGRVGELVARAVRAPRAPSTGALMTTFDGASVEDVVSTVASAWERTHAK